MRNRDALAALDAVGRAYGVRPSAILGVVDEWAAFQLDVAAVVAGGGETGEVQAGGQGQAQGTRPIVIDARRTVVLGGQAAARKPAGYRDPSIYVSRKMVIPPSGVW